MQTYKHYIILILTTIIVIATINGQSIPKPTDYTSNIQYFDEKDGLTANAIEMVTTDNRGVTWMSTSNGLVRFDGKNFKLFSLDEGKHPNHLRRLKLIGDELWCEHLDVNGYNAFGDVSIFHTKEERLIPWETYDFPFSKNDIKEFRIVPQVNALFFWVKHKDGTAIYELNQKKEISLKRIIPKGLYWTGNPSEAHIIINEKESYYFQKIDKNEKVLFKTQLDDTKEGAFYVIMAQDAEKEEMWLYTDGEGREQELYRLDKTGKLTRWKHHKQLVQQLYSTPSSSILSWKLQYLPKYDAFAYAYKNIFFIIKTNGELMHLTYLEGKEVFDIIGIDEENDVFWLSDVENKKILISVRSISIKIFLRLHSLTKISALEV